VSRGREEPRGLLGFTPPLPSPPLDSALPPLPSLPLSLLLFSALLATPEKTWPTYLQWLPVIKEYFREG